MLAASTVPPHQVAQVVAGIGAGGRFPRPVPPRDAALPGGRNCRSLRPHERRSGISLPMLPLFCRMTSAARSVSWRYFSVGEFEAAHST